MAKYNDGKEKNIDLITVGKWHILTKKEFEKYEYEDISYDEMLEEGYVTLELPEGKFLQDVFEKGDSLYPDFDLRIELSFYYENNDILKFNPKADKLYFPYSDYEAATSGTIEVILNQKEKEYFSSLLQMTIGDNHTPEMQEIMTQYHESSDRIISDFINDVIHERDTVPVTVGYFSEKQRRDIEFAVEVKFAPRVLIVADAIRYIIKRHGKTGKLTAACQII